MAESNATQVILTDDGIKIIKAQNTADNATSGVADLNDPNLMSVIEKQTAASQYAGLTSQYNVILARAKDAKVSTTTLTTAYTNLDTFMTSMLTDTAKASGVNRDTYKELTDDYNTALSDVQNALKNAYNADIDNMQFSVSVASQAASSAAIVASQAAIAGDNASHEATQAAIAASQAQITGNNANSVANNASQAASSAILVGSQAAVSANKASADYQTLSAGVKDGSVVHITTETVIDKGVIGTAEIANGAITNAQIGNEAVNSAKIANLAVGTAQIGDGAITNAKIGKLAVGTAQIANAAITDAQVGNVSANKLTAGTIDFNTITGKNINASNITTGTLSTDRLNVGKLSALSANLGNVTTGSLKGVDIIANSFSTPNGSFTTDANGAVVASNLTIRGVTNLVYNAALLGNSGTYPNTKVPGWNLFTKGYYSNATLHDGVPSIGFNSSTGGAVWTTFAQSKLYPLNGLHGQPYSASVWFIDDGSEAAMKYQFTLAFFDANGNRLASGYAGNTWNGNPTAQGWTYKTIDNIISPSTAVYVGIQYWAYNGTGHALFSSPMLTQTAQSTGYQPDTGNVVSAGEIDGSVINGSTINGTTFNGGSAINNSNNTAGYYPMTITPDGGYKSTYFDNAVGLQSSVESGAISYKYRSMIGSNGQYLFYDSVINGQGFESHSGYTSAKDTTFSNTETITGYVNVTPSLGIYLYGPTQKINFAGNSDNIGSDGITMDSYGNLYGQNTSAYWRIGDSDRKRVADFGLDKKSGHQIIFSRNTSIGNLFLGVGHTIGMLDKKPLYFKRGDSRGNMLDIKAGAVHYTSLVKSSLLSVKKDVKRVDTAYWSQLVNSIDLATYQYKSDDNTSHIRLSSIVDDVNDTKQWRLPDVFVSRDENGKLTGVDDSVLLNATLATVQEQQKEIDQLNGHNMELEARLNKLEAKLNG
ncbi:phage tail protein [Lactiplantibacillus pentosus]|uniref:phage tail protein n=1 Tax=Lactiplantibacillus pentosus TaxID=1589 RepID=UPI001C1FCD2F|nr:phage tail protein [Lactiplantibacillus pentosus]MBU7503812.1 phage tail protein [Lactiplantibacillus pentosus]MDY1544767.1 phage tail protein [Lactiplantibacillus pentosus]